MKAVFITGTDTGVGKTIVTGLLGHYLCQKGYKVITQKWIQTGQRGPRDTDVHLKLMRRKRVDVRCHLSSMSPYTFRFPASPHLSALLEKRKIYPHKIKESFTSLSRRFDFVIVEGIGGVLVPFNRKGLVIDIAKELNLPVLIVTQNRLGAINHTLLTVEALGKRQMKIIGIIFNSQSEKGNEVILSDNPKIIKALTNERILGSLPWLKNQDLLYKAFVPIGNRVLAQMKRK